MQASYLLPVIHPSFELLKKSAKVLHFLAAAAILANAFHQYRSHDGSVALCITQGIIALDIFILVFFTGDTLMQVPKLNIIFRIIETLMLLGIAIILFLGNHIIFGLAHLAASFGYYFLLHREVRVIKAENVRIQSTGVTLPDLQKDAEIGWHEIKSIIPKYHSIVVETFRNKKLEFNLRQNLKIDELEKLNDFCRQHMRIG
jgi:hypothetical protein